MDLSEKLESWTAAAVAAAKVSETSKAALLAYLTQSRRRRLQGVRNQKCALLRLPSSVLCNIIDSSNRVTISHVCHGLRQWALSTPALWTDITMPTRYSPTFWSEILRRSGSSPVDIFMFFLLPHEDVSQYCDMVKDNIWHVGTLSLAIPLEVCRKIISALQSTPSMLKNFTVDLDGFDMTSDLLVSSGMFIPNAPALESLTCGPNLGEWFTHIPHVNLSSLRSLDVDLSVRSVMYPVTALATFLSGVPNLEKLALRNFEPPERNTIRAFVRSTPQLRRLELGRKSRIFLEEDFMLGLGSQLRALNVEVAKPIPEYILAIWPSISRVSFAIYGANFIAEQTVYGREELKVRMKWRSSNLTWSPSLQTALQMTSLAIHEHFWPIEYSEMDDLHALQYFRIMLSTCAENVRFEPQDNINRLIPVYGIFIHGARVTLSSSIQTVHISYVSRSRCYKATVKPNLKPSWWGPCVCRKATSLALSDVHDFALSRIQWPATCKVKLRLTGVAIIDVDPWTHLCRLQNLFDEVEISKRSERNW